MSNIDLAWAGGLFEGEGCITRHKISSQSGSWEYPRLHLSSTDEDIVKRFQEIVHKGSITQVNSPSRGNRKPMWRWGIQGKGAEDIAWTLMPYLGIRRRTRFLEVILKEDIPLEPLPVNPNTWIPVALMGLLVPWAGGLFEGEGCIYSGRYEAKQNGSRSKYMELQLAMTDEDIVRMFHEVADFGSVRYINPKIKNRKPVWAWKGTGKKAEAFMWKLAPYLGDRRRAKFSNVLIDARMVGE